MTGLWVSGAFALGGTGVGSAGAYAIARLQAKSARDLARQERSHLELARAYEEFMVNVMRIEAAVRQARNDGKWTVPGPDDDDLFRLAALLFVYGTTKMREESETFNQVVREFKKHVQELEVLERIEAPLQTDEIRARIAAFHVGFEADCRSVIDQAEVIISQIRREMLVERSARAG